MLLSGALVWIGLLALSPSLDAHSIWEGSWIIKVGKGGYDRTLKCGRYLDHIVREFKVTLDCPDVATDEFGNKGHWTSVYEYGIEIVIQGRKFYSFPGAGRVDNSSCVQGDGSARCSWYYYISLGLSHDLLGNNWACFYGRPSWHTEESDEKMIKEMIKEEDEPKRSEEEIRSGKELFRTDLNLIKQINEGQEFWKAERYPEFENMTMDQIINMAGGKYTHKLKFPKTNPSKEQRNSSSYPSLPTNFDWRNVRGKNFVSPVRHQGHCGSCYAFAATAMHESRVRILTNNQVQTIYSPQDVVDCSPYAWGCNGGVLFGEGKYGEDYGFAEESCSPYVAYRKTCTSVNRCRRSYATNYEFIGTHFGRCDEESMRYALFYNGPIVAGFLVYRDFIYYRTGIYYHYNTWSWPLGGHAVTIVGYGEDSKTGTKYWIVKNSWGTSWGENGYFKIIRGVNECWFESLAWQSFPIL